MINKTAWNHVFSNNVFFSLSDTRIKSQKKITEKTLCLIWTCLKFSVCWVAYTMTFIYPIDEGGKYFVTSQHQLDAVQSKKWRFVSWYKTRKVLHEYFISKLFRYSIRNVSYGKHVWMIPHHNRYVWDFFFVKWCVHVEVTWNHDSCSHTNTQTHKHIDTDIRKIQDRNIREHIAYQVQHTFVWCHSIGNTTT